MSSKKINRSNFVNFEEVWIRILSTTKIKNYKKLAEVVGVSGSAVTTRAQKKEFPVEWGFLVAKEFGLSTDWLLTGEGEAKTTEKKEFLAEIEGWLDEIGQNKPEFKIWFKVQFEAKFPEFIEWKKRKEGAAGQNNLSASSKIANDNSK